MSRKNCGDEERLLDGAVEKPTDNTLRVATIGGTLREVPMSARPKPTQSEFVEDFSPLKPSVEAPRASSTRRTSKPRVFLMPGSLAGEKAGAFTNTDPDQRISASRSIA
jgi:hypothetical protein